MIGKTIVMLPLEVDSVCRLCMTVIDWRRHNKLRAPSHQVDTNVLRYLGTIYYVLSRYLGSKLLDHDQSSWGTWLQAETQFPGHWDLRNSNSKPKEKQLPSWNPILNKWLLIYYIISQIPL